MPEPHPFTAPHSEPARAAFAQKPRGLVDKVTTVAEAVRRFVRGGDYLATGGFGTNRIPTAVCHEILRQRKQHLGFSGHTTTHDFQVLCAGNLTGRGQTLDRVDAAYIVGIEARGLSPHARRVMESGAVRCAEWSNYALALRYTAAAMGVPFLPTHSMLGTDTLTHSPATTIECPFTGEKLAAVPALYPDVAAIHVHEADRYGNCRFVGTSVADFDLARAAKRVIVTCERLVPHDEMRRNPHLTQIPFLCVDAVCEVPFGSYPGNMPGEYFSDEDHLRLWLEVERDPAAFAQFLDDHIFGVESFAEYLDRCGGLPRLQHLRHRELLLHLGK
ncbi:acyl :acetate 3-ketoacid alpha subunit : AtoD: acyl CoA:acetate/3-ketoacid CoA transferase, alpha subunit OS=Desulfobacula toluolica (strain DSM 7467 / Tol2) GN=atoD PE=4 SV=1: CoA_trans [Gemmataceae bacterium]|nr:acyl :acetate 3-ketoacid alpha subunit : AtoD: acyl CoA:acetate/3-ketoacid CoA transferase, alpha subunit OS=Desulfobacula toluolica (strain DSM 7467 / Tol2) GN=atoD PE=4 SV=1: CoA_trans [Gemmataceae bacterium]VTT97778.1 acyl :acetate 3-ketoacid alpha subunit : AtoD: acyl CoA:acetate/3-ketoacid CoA transferase, alpha subunit OS=Desulfobacula toluolica (strain DSM 7467 / Tol2) GN=atoD PE=4 SV=1: CoA_trans [Gemmataceae bacterium]